MTAIPRESARAGARRHCRGAVRCVTPAEGRAVADRRRPPALPRSQACALLLTVVTATVVVSACQDANATGQTPPQPPRGGYAEDRACKIGVPNGGLSAAGGAAFTSAAQRTGCYFTVANATTTITPYSSVSVKVANVQSGFTPNVTIRIYNGYDGQQVSDGGVTFLTIPSGHPDYYAADVTSTPFPAGRFQSPDPNHNWRLRDSAFALFGNLQSQYNPAFGYSILIGVRDDLYPPGLNGPDYIQSTESLSYSYEGGASPIGMSYQWWLDGALRPETGPQLTVSNLRPGSHTLQATATREGDGTSTTVSKTVVSQSPTCTGWTCPQ